MVEGSNPSGRTVLQTLNKMKSFKSNLIVLLFILIITVLAGIFIFPKGYGAQYLPWRLGLDLTGGSALVYQIDLSGVEKKDYENVMAGLKQVIEKRVNLYGVSEPKVVIAKKGDSYELLVELAGIKDLKDAVRQIGETPNLDFRAFVPDMTIDKFIALENKFSESKKVEDYLAIINAFSPPKLTGRYISGASLEYDSFNKPIVSLNFNGEGAKLFEEITGANIGKPLAIFIDGQLTDMPQVNEKISGGSAQISGGGAGFKKDEAIKLVERLNAGALSAPIKLINQRTVGASAAADALSKIIIAGIVGTLLVMLFMIIYYRIFGVFASIALVMYTILTLALFKLVPNFTMSLAGIAGFVLSIGMAVDANILIFERSKEELKKGLSKASAIQEGFRRAWPSIRDSNISTMITATILYYFTSSFVKGFALTLGLGVLVSMFSAIFITRTLLKVFIRK